ncbi:autotransporter-associated beta strand repeat-containing protein [Luteolibacter sp. LG18]|uniref:beta strand repeat-containing protein n=1 Tax=Luteolibacter sp. LG18 TaxID=2819286 RepID=UPI002B2A1FF6|nr:hypothetical protein llg_25870 [Luteolibacter sp. LG18]
MHHACKAPAFLLVAFVLLATFATARGAAESDIAVGYSYTYMSGAGGSDQMKANVLNQFAGANNVSAVSGSPHRQKVVGFYQSSQDNTNRTSTGGMVGWLSGNDSRISDVVAYGNSVGADLVTYICANNDSGSIGAVAQQPGKYSAYNPGSVYYLVFAHESGGHNFGLNHGDATVSPKTIMAHNYCGGGAQGYYTNPNIWLNGVKLLGTGNCTGGTIYGGDDAYRASTSAQGRADATERLVFGSSRGSITHRWQFNRPAAAAPAGTVITDDVAGAQAIVRGQGATFTGTALRLPGGTTGNAAADSIAAYLDLPNGIFSAMPSFTIEVWATPRSAQNWMRVIDIGRTTDAGDGLGAAGEYTGTPGSAAPGTTTAYDDLMLSAAIGSNLGSQRFEAKLAGASTVTADSSLATIAGDLHHYAITFADTSSGATIKWFRDGALIKTLNAAFHSASLQDVNNWLGRSLYSADAMADIDYLDVRIQSVALADGEVTGNYRIGPNDAKATLYASDPLGSSGFVSGSWEFGAAPVSTRDYDTADCRLRTPANGANNTFPGKSLTVSNGSLLLKGTAANTTTIADLRLSGGTVIQAGGNYTQSLAGTLSVINSSTNHIRGGNGRIDLKSTITGFGTLLYSENAVTLGGTNTGYTGQTIIGDGRFSTLVIGKEENLGANPPWYGGAWLELNRGILSTTATLTLDDANRGIRIGPGGGFLSPVAGTTLTIATPVNSPAAGDTLKTAPMDSNPIVGILFKDDSGTVVLTNPNNSHNAEMQVLKGELRLAGNGRFNNGDHWMPVTVNGTLTDDSALDQTLRGVLSGSGAIVKSNAATLNLNGANTFTGSVTVNGGTLYTNPGNAATNRALSYAGTITVNNGGTLRSGPNGLFGWDGTKEKTITVNSGGTLVANGGLTSDVGVGTVILNGGTLATLATGATDYGSWRFDNATDKLSVTADSTVSAANVKFGHTSAAIDVATGKTLNFTGTITDTTSGGISYLTKSGGTGRLVLAGANTYTGSTAIQSGELRVDGSLAAGSSVTVDGGATLSGTGTLGGAVTFAANAIHAPGAATGTQTIGGALSYASSSRVKWTLAANGTAANDASRIAAATVGITAGAALDLVLNPAGGTVDFTQAFWNQPRTWTVMTGSAITGAFTLGTVTADSVGHPVSNYGSFSLQQTATAITLAYTPQSAAVTWQQAYFGAQWNNSAIAGDAADPDSDGIPNLCERAFGGNPNTADPDILPRVDPSAPLLSILYRKGPDAADLTFSVMESTGFSGAWTPAAGQSTILGTENGITRIRFTAPANGATRKFLKVVVSQP